MAVTTVQEIWSGATNSDTLSSSSSSTLSPSEPAAAAIQQRTSDGIIDRRVFQGVVDLDDTDSTDFSTQMVNTYLAVATSTLADMDRAVENKDISKLSLLAVSLQDTSDAMGVTEVRQSCSRLREVIRVWNETEEGAGASIDGIIALHGQLKSEFALAKSWLMRYVETGNVPPDDGSTRGGAVMACGVAATSADPNGSWW